MLISFRGNTTISCNMSKTQLSLQLFSFAKNFSYAAFEGPVRRFGEVDDGAAVMDLTPLTISNCLRHRLIAASKRSWISNSFVRPSNVAASPSSVNSYSPPSSSLAFSICDLHPV